MDIDLIIEKLNTIKDDISNDLSSLRDYNLLSDILKSDQEITDIIDLIKQYLKYNSIDSFLCYYKEIFALILVFNAKTGYNSEDGFWDSLYKLLEDFRKINRKDVRAYFEYILKQYKLNEFTDELVDGYKIITQIICHSGIPYNSLDGLLDFIYTIRKVRYDLIEGEIDYYLRYANKPVKRYLKFLSGKGMLEDIVSQYLDAINSIINNGECKITNIISEKISEIIKDWYFNKQHRNAENYCPILKLDTNTFELSLTTPQIKYTNSSTVFWMIGEREREKPIKVYGEKKGDEYRFRERQYFVTNIEKLEYKLLDEHKNEITNGVIRNDLDITVFNNNGDLINSNIITKKNNYFLCSSEYNVEGDVELVSTNCSGLYLYKSNDGNIDSIEFVRKDKVIKYVVKEKPYFEDGEKLFNGFAEFEGVDPYYKLPDIILPNTDTWTIEIKTESFETIITVNGRTRVNLETELTNNVNKISYGKYGFRIHNDDMGYSFLKLLYLPCCKVKINGCYPPYDCNYSLEFETDDNIEIFDQNKRIGKQVTILPDVDIFTGVVKYGELLVSFSITVKVFTWEIYDPTNPDKEYGLRNSLTSLNLRDFNYDSQIVLLAKNNAIETKKLVISFGGKREKEYYLYSNKTKLINLTELIEYFKEVNSSTIKIKDVNCDYTICNITRNIEVTNFKYYKHGNNYSFTWEEMGSKTNRSLVMYNLYNPLDFIIFPINDGNTSMGVIVDSPDNDFIAEIRLNKKKDNRLIPNPKNCIYINNRENFNEAQIKSLLFSDLIYQYLFHYQTNKLHCNIELILREEEAIIEARCRNGDEEFYRIINQGRYSKYIKKISNRVSLYLPIYLGYKKLNMDVLDTIKECNYLSYLLYIYTINEKNLIVQSIVEIQDMKDENSWFKADESIIYNNYRQDTEFFESVREYVNAGIRTKEAMVKTFIDYIFEFDNRRLFIVDHPKYSKLISNLCENYSQTFYSKIIDKIRKKRNL